MAESLLLPVVHGVIGKATNALVQKVTRMYGVDGDHRKLERQLLAVERLLADAEAKSETNPAVKRWMKDLVEIMGIPYLHGDDIWTEYRIPNMDRISYMYSGFVS